MGQKRNVPSWLMSPARAPAPAPRSHPRGWLWSRTVFHPCLLPQLWVRAWGPVRVRVSRHFSLTLIIDREITQTRQASDTRSLCDRTGRRRRTRTENCLPSSPFSINPPQIPHLDRPFLLIKTSYSAQPTFSSRTSAIRIFSHQKPKNPPPSHDKRPGPTASQRWTIAASMANLPRAWERRSGARSRGRAGPRSRAKINEAGCAKQAGELSGRDPPSGPSGAVPSVDPSGVTV